MNAGTAEKAAQTAQETVERLQMVLGKQPGSLRIYTGGSYVDTTVRDMADAVKQMAKVVKDNYAFVSADFDNLNMYVTLYDGDFSIYLNLSIS